MKKFILFEYTVVVHRLWRSLRWMPAFFAVLLLIAFATVQIPRIQTQILNESSEFLVQNTSFRLSVQKANLMWYDRMIFENVRFYHFETDSTMIDVDRVELDFGILHYLMTREVKGDKLILINPELHLIKETDSTSVNINQFYTELKTIFSKDTTAKKSTININEVLIKNGTLTYNDRRKAHIDNYKIVSFNRIDSEIRDLTFEGQNLSLQFDNLTSLNNPSAVEIETLKAKLLLTKTSLILEDLNLRTDHSEIGDSIALHFDRIDHLKYLYDSVHFDLNLKKSVLHIRDLKVVSPWISLPHEKYILSGHYSGQLQSLFMNNAEIAFGNQSILRGSGYLNGLPDKHETFIDFDFKDTHFHLMDLRNVLDSNLYAKSKSFENLTINGSFSGFLNDYQTDCQLSSHIGEIDLDLKMKINKHKQADYIGNVGLYTFDINKLYPTYEDLKSVSLSGKIKGSGLDPKHAKFDLEAYIDTVRLSNTLLTNIETSGHFEENYYQAKFNIASPSISSAGQFTFDFRKTLKSIALTAQLDSVDLNSLSLTNRKMILKSHVDMNLSAHDIDNINGTIELNNFRIVDFNRNLNLKNVKITSRQNSNNRSIQLSTDGLSASLDGYFENKKFLISLKSLRKEVLLHLLNDKSDLEDYYAEKSKFEIDPFEARVKIDVSKPERFMQYLNNDLSIKGALNINGHLIQDDHVNFSILASADTITYKNQEMSNNSLDIHISKTLGDGDILGSLHLKSADQKWFGDLYTANSALDVIWDNDNLDFWIKSKQQLFESNAILNGQVRFKDSNTEIRMLPSELTLFGRSWKWNERNRILIKNKRLFFSDFSIVDNEQKIQLTTGLNHNMGLNLRNILLNQISTYLPYEFSGYLNAKVNFPSDQKPNFSTNLDITQGKLGDTRYPDIIAAFNKPNASKQIATSIRFNDKGLESLRLTGSVDINAPYNLDLIGEFNNFNLKYFQPYVEGKFSNLEGMVNGNLFLEEELFEPAISGQTIIKKGKVTTDYLGTTYSFDGSLGFENHEIEFKNIAVTDAGGNPGVLAGSIFHQGKDNMTFELDGSFTNFNVLNTTSKNNTLYYGVANATGEVAFRGTRNELIVDAQAISTRGTRLSVPLGESQSTAIQQKDYIQFKSIRLTEDKNKTVTSSLAAQNTMSGIVLNLDLQMTKDAYMEIIFDIKSGDIIRGRGNGNLKMEINTQGDFDMFGSYYIEEGGYNFTLYNIINKEFDINEGSSITWLGDPYGAQLDINATYNQLASIAPLITNLDERDLNSPEIKKKYPAEVQLYLQGDLLTPDIAFDINMTDYPRTIGTTGGNGRSYDLEQYFNAFKTRVSSNEQEMNRQVFSLIVLRKFSPEEGFQVSSQTIGSSFSEFISNQLSYWANQVDENLEIDVDLSSLDQEAFDTFQLRLSYTFLDGRLRVTRGGGLVNSNQEREDIYTVIGDWSVEYLLTADGRFRAKLYSRSDLNAIDRQIGENPLETGISLQYVKSFDELSQVLRSNRARNLKPQKENDSSN